MVPGVFEWDSSKAEENLRKHGVSFEEARRAFFDQKRIIVTDAGHSEEEERFFCIGDTGAGIATVRFTYRQEKIRLIGAGYWRKGRKHYEKENQVR